VLIGVLIARVLAELKTPELDDHDDERTQIATP